MQRLFSAKLLSTAPRNLNSSSLNSRFASESSFASLFKSHPCHPHSCHSHQPYRLSSHYVTSCSRPWQLENAPLKQASRFIINGSLVTRLLPNAKTLLKLPGSGPVGRGRVGFVKDQFQRRSFHSNSLQSWKWRLKTDGVVLGLILTNVAVFMLWRVMDHDFMKENFMISLDNFRSGRVHTLITSAFSHIEAGHIISNMIGLYFFGMNIGRVFGPEYLLKLYLAGAVAGSVFYLIHHAYMSLSSKGRGIWSMDYSRVPGLGASGAVTSIMLLDIFLFPKSTLYLEFFIPVPAILLGIFLIGQDVLRILQGDNRVSGSGHLGGAAVAAIAWMRIRKGRF